MSSSDPLSPHSSPNHDMDLLGVAEVAMESIHDIRRWAFVRCPSIVDNNPDEPEFMSSRSPFPFDAELNKQVALWAGDVTRLRDIDAIVNPTNEPLTSRDPVSVNIVKAGGPQLGHQLAHNVRGCKTGEARLTEGFGLPSRFVIHVVGPRYHEKYATAAETALYQAYRSVLELVHSESLYSVGLTCIHSIRRGYPIKDGAHIAARTVRHFLQRSLKPTAPEDVGVFQRHSWSLPGADPLFVFCVTDAEIDVYKEILALYFPRSLQEEKWACLHLPSDLGGKYGEPLRPDRNLSLASRFPFPTPGHITDHNGLLEEIAADESVAVGRSAFAAMEDDHDKKAIQRHRVPAKRQSGERGSISETVDQRLLYSKLLEMAKKEDLSRFSSLRCLFRSGVDREGRAVMVFVGRHLSFSRLDVEKALLYLVHVMDPVANKPFNLVYLNTMCTGETRPDMGFLRRIVDVLPGKYNDNIINFFVVHPTVLCRVFMWFFTSFKASAMKQRYLSIKSLHQLYSFIPPDQLDIPPFVLHHDMRVNPENYHQNYTGNQLPRLTESDVATGWTSPGQL